MEHEFGTLRWFALLLTREANTNALASRRWLVKDFITLWSINLVGRRWLAELVCHIPEARGKHKRPSFVGFTDEVQDGASDLVSCCGLPYSREATKKRTPWNMKLVSCVGLPYS